MNVIVYTVTDGGRPLVATRVPAFDCDGKTVDLTTDAGTRKAIQWSLIHWFGCIDTLDPHFLPNFWGVALLDRLWQPMTDDDRYRVLHPSLGYRPATATETHQLCEDYGNVIADDVVDPDTGIPSWIICLPWTSGLLRRAAKRRDDPPDLRAYGWVMMALQRDGAVVPTGCYTPSSQKASRHRPKLLWRSLIYRGPEG
jgi:hypothetical protein